jgi:hypothetical protein
VADLARGFAGFPCVIFFCGILLMFFCTGFCAEPLLAAFFADGAGIIFFATFDRADFAALFIAGFFVVAGFFVAVAFAAGFLAATVFATGFAAAFADAFFAAGFFTSTIFFAPAADTGLAFACDFATGFVTGLDVAIMHCPMVRGS